MWIAAPLTKIIVISQRKSITRNHPNPSYPRKFMTHRIAVSVEKNQPSYRMIQSIDAKRSSSERRIISGRLRGRPYRETGAASAGTSAM
jgi:hypothetical protein